MKESLQNIISNSEKIIKDSEFRVERFGRYIEERKRLFKEDIAEDEKYIEEHKNEIKKHQLILDMAQKELKRKK